MSVAFDDDVDLTLEAAFGDSALETSPTWTDISAYLRLQGGLRWDRGRGHERDTVRPTTLTCVLDNTDGRFDPSYTSGAYYPNVKLNVPVRLRATYNSTTYDLFYGFADSWDQQWPAMKDSVVTLTATDGFKILNGATTSTEESAERSGARIGNLLDDASWPAGWRDIATGQVDCPAYGRPNANVLNLIRQVARAENSLFFVAGDGSATFHDRYHRSQRSTLATFGDSGSELRYQDMVLGFDDSQLWNDVEVVRTGQSGVQSQSDSTSITAYGRRTLRMNDVLVAGDNQASGLAELLRDVYAEPELHVRRIVVTPRRDPSGLWPVVLAGELGDEVVAKRRPPAGNTITETVYIEGIGHEVAGKQWTTTLYLSHFTVGDGPFLKLGDDPDGKLGTGKLGY